MKTIRSTKDLAINGAKPAFSLPLHVGRPNLGDFEIFSEYCKGIFDRRWLTNDGPLILQFEKEIADFLKVKHCIAMCNGTVALEIAIRALGLEGEVIIPSYTFIATAHALSWQEITPVFADINPVTHLLSPSAVRRMITPRTSGIIGVHLWGQGSAVEELHEIAEEFELKLMFDAAHAFGCSYKNKMIGNFGSCEVFSFHATKFFNTFEGGAVVTNDDNLAEAIRLMRNFGFIDLDNVIHPGTNGKMSEISAAMGLTNFKSINSTIEKNKLNYLSYVSFFSKIPNINILQFDEEQKNNYQYIILEVKSTSRTSRDDIVKALHAENILSRKYFWPGCHNMKPYRELYPHAGLLLPNTKNVADRVFLLPTGETVTHKDIKKISSIIEILTN